MITDLETKTKSNVALKNNIRDYIAIARPDHWIKHIFIVPGIIFPLLMIDVEIESVIIDIFYGFASACLIASANYVINEWLDAESDQQHPLKKERPAASGRISAKYVYLEYSFLSLLGLLIAVKVGLTFATVTVLFWVSGVIYNVKPFRTKDRTYFDVLTEALNNPIRLLLGWCMVSKNTIPPVSLFLTYWFSGAFLMVTKRLAEYRFLSRVKDKETLICYRLSFMGYDENKLIHSCFFYGMLSSFFMAIFLVKYRNEFIIAFPLFAILFTYYLSIGLKPESVTQTPEKLYKDKRLIFIVIFLICAVCLLSYIDIPLIRELYKMRYFYVR